MLNPVIAVCLLAKMRTAPECQIWVHKPHTWSEVTRKETRRWTAGEKDSLVPTLTLWSLLCAVFICVCTCTCEWTLVAEREVLEVHVLLIRESQRSCSGQQTCRQERLPTESSHRPLMSHELSHIIQSEDPGLSIVGAFISLQFFIMIFLYVW